MDEFAASDAAARTSKKPVRAAVVAPRDIAFAVSIGAGVAAGLFLAWTASGALLLVFAGLLFAALLDAGTDGLGHVLPIARGWRLTIVIVALVLALAVGLATGGYAIVAQASELGGLIADQFDALRRALRSAGVTPQDLGASPDRGFVDLFLPDTSTLFGHAGTLFGTTLGFAGNAAVIAFIGLFVAADPLLYREGAVMLAPARHREHLRDALDEMALSLRSWLVGQFATMILVWVSTSLALMLIGMPNALLLGALAGLLNFLPYVGPVLAAVPIVLAAMPSGLVMVASVTGVFVLIQSLEGYVISPLIQRRAVDIPPALALGGLVVFGALFGAMGVALATPLLAVIRVAVIRIADEMPERG